MKMRKIGVIHPHLSAGGGSEAVALWILAALQDIAEITLLTSGDVDLPRLNDSYRTAVKQDRLQVLSISLFSLFGVRFDALRSARLARFIKNMSPDFDLMISSYNPCDFGKRGLQFIGDFSFDDQARRELHPGPGGLKNVLYKRSFLRSSYLRLGKIWSRDRQSGWKENVTISNSHWTRDRVLERYGVDSAVIYPPVSSVHSTRPWEEREDGIVCIGRISPEKRIESLVGITERLRERGHRLHIHILGGKSDPSYFRRMQKIFRERRDWVHYEGPVFGEAKERFLSGHKYGLSGCRHEAFGIAVAEMVGSGMIVWVPAGGGQVEVVDHPDLVYRDEDDAAGKIVRILDSRRTQNEVRERLLPASLRFSSERFVAEVRDLVSRLLPGTGRASNVTPSR
jgi:glycosyltransferase involved in cell wall biosynthesis